MEAVNSLATASRLIVGNTLLATGVCTCARRGEWRLLLLLLLLLQLLLLLLLAAAVADRRSAWAAAVLMLA